MEVDDKSVVKNERKNNPQSLVTMIDNYIKVNLIQNVIYHGFVHCIDPISHSLILQVPKDGNYQTIFIPGHAITDLVEESPPDNLQPPTRKVLPTENTQVLNAVKNRLIAWFKWNLLPVSETDEKIVVGAVNILPPYNVSNIYAENSVIALQIRRIMERIPKDFHV